MNQDPPAPHPSSDSKETPEEVAGRFERERRHAFQQREDDLTLSLSPYRVGSVRYLNAVPLTRGLEEQVLFATPAELADLLRRDQLDAALVSVTETLLTDRYDILDGMAVASLGEVVSVFLAHRKPIIEAKEIFCDPASLTSVNLLKVLLAEQGLKPQFQKLQSYDAKALPDFTLLIGDRAIDFVRAPHAPFAIWDLGAAWHESMQLPFVYAVWAVRKGVDYLPLAQRLREARNLGLDTLESIIRERKEYDQAFRRDYLGWHIHYHMGAEERAGIARFAQLLDKHGLGPVYSPKFLA